MEVSTETLDFPVIEEPVHTPVLCICILNFLRHDSASCWLILISAYAADRTIMAGNQRPRGILLAVAYSLSQASEPSLLAAPFALIIKPNIESIQ
jgi:hypothetical protein